MNLLLIEDDSIQRRVLFEILEGMSPEVQVMGFTDSIQSTLEWFINHPQPDLIFLTTQLPDGPSFNLFKEIRISCPLVFMAQDGRSALGSFKFNTIDYLIRPITPNGIISSLFKFRTLKQLFSEIPNLVSSFPENPKLESPNRSSLSIKNRFAIHIGDKIKSIETSEMAYFMADGNVVFLTTSQSDRFTINYTLEDIFARLNPEEFFRLNRTFIVHIRAIKEVRKFFNGRLKILLQPIPDLEDEVYVSRNRVSEFMKWLGE